MAKGLEAEKIVKQCRAEYEAGLMFRKDRELQWAQNEDFYLNRVKRNLKSKFNVPVPIVPGFVDTWKAKMSKHPALTFEQSESADYIAAKKATALLNRIKVREDYDWDMLDSDGNQVAALYGKVTYAYMAHSKPKYQSVLDLIDPYDVVDDPMGGADTEKYKFRAQDNVFKSKSELVDGADEGMYDPAQVSKLINAVKADRLVDKDTIFQSKQNRFMALGLDGITYNYAGQDMYKLVAQGTMWKGRRYYVVYNYETGVWVRCEYLKDVFKSDLWPWVSWFPIRDPFTPLPKAPVEDIIPIAETIRVLVNQELDNRHKRNYGQRAYDMSMFPNPAELEWRQDGLVAVNLEKVNSRVSQIAQGIYQFETPELQGTINLVSWMDNLLKEKTGVNSEAQGQSDTSKVGIAFLNVQQSAERTKAAMESRTKCWQAIDRRFLWGLVEHMRSPMAVKIIGEIGEQWTELARNEINPEWDIVVSGGEEDMNRDEIKKKALRDTLATLTPPELMVMNPKMTAQIKLEGAEVEEDMIRQVFDLSDETNKEVLSKASQMIQDCLANKPYALYRAATTAFVQKIMDYADENYPTYTPDQLALLKPAEQEKHAAGTEKFMKLMRLAQAHMEFAAQNAARKAVQTNAQRGLPPPEMAPPGLPEEPAMNTPAGTQSLSQGMTNMAPQI